MATDSVSSYPIAECTYTDDQGTARWRITLSIGHVVSVKTYHWASARAAVRSAQAQAAMTSRWPNCIGNQTFGN